MSGVTRWNADVRCWHTRRSPPSSTRKPAAIVRRARRQFVRCLGFRLESEAVLDLVTERLKPRPEILDPGPDRRDRSIRQCAAALFARICSWASFTLHPATDKTETAQIPMSLASSGPTSARFRTVCKHLDERTLARKSGTFEATRTRTARTRKVRACLCCTPSIADKSIADLVFSGLSCKACVARLSAAVSAVPRAAQWSDPWNRTAATMPICRCS